MQACFCTEGGVAVEHIESELKRLLVHDAGDILFELSSAQLVQLDERTSDKAAQLVSAARLVTVSAADHAHDPRHTRRSKERREVLHEVSSICVNRRCSNFAPEIPSA